MGRTNNHSSVTFPDFRNLGVILRGLVVAEGTIFLVILAVSQDLADAFAKFGNTSMPREPIILLNVMVFFLCSPFLSRLRYGLGTTFAIALSGITGLGGYFIFSGLIPSGLSGGGIRTVIQASLTSAVVFLYFNWRQRTLSPALAEARLSALQARIRPHFLFNSLNTVLGLIRSDPRRAESVLENLADLFRALMADSRTLVPLQREMELARAYAEIESLRLGDRLKIIWHDEGAPLTAQVPQLILQPLLENAVLHGIEPSSEGGEVHVNLFMKGGRLVIVIRNPLLPDSAKREGNQMALANIRERLDLHFDAEARMTHFSAGGEFVVQVEMPVR